MTIADTYIKYGLIKRANAFDKLTSGKWNPLHYVRKGTEWALSDADDNVLTSGKWNPLHYARKGAKQALHGNANAIALKLKSKDYKTNMQDWKRHRLMLDRSGSIWNNIKVHDNLSSLLNDIMRNKQLSDALRNRLMANAYAKAQSNLRTVPEGWNQLAAAGRYAGKYLNPVRWFVSDLAEKADEAMLGAHYLTQVSSQDMLNPELIRRQQNIADASDYVLDGVKVNGKQVAIKDPALLARMTMIPDTVVASFIPGVDKMRLSGEQVDLHLNAAMDAREALNGSGFQTTAYIPHASTTLNLGTMLPASLYSPALSAYMQHSLMPRVTNIPANTATSMFNHIYQNDMSVAEYWADMLKRLGVSQ